MSGLAYKDLCHPHGTVLIMSMLAAVTAAQAVDASEGPGFLMSWSSRQQLPICLSRAPSTSQNWHVIKRLCDSCTIALYSCPSQNGASSCPRLGCGLVYSMPTTAGHVKSALVTSTTCVQSTHCRICLTYDARDEGVVEERLHHKYLSEQGNIPAAAELQMLHSTMP